MSQEMGCVEVTFFGPGYGECVVVNLGNSNWIIIDSCVDAETQEPVALTYLNKLGVDPKKAVKMVIATHWHDDHIRGMSDVLSECENARFCCSVALTSDEFLATVINYDSRNRISAKSGVQEILGVYKVLEKRSGNLQTPIYASANRLAFSISEEDSGHGVRCNIWVLSPSDAQVKKFYEELSGLMPMPAETKRRAVPQRQNHISIVTWIEVGGVSILLGGDLEETKNEGTGWSVITSSNERPVGKASVFKIPHHGSETGHSENVWQDMVIEDVYSVLTPYNRGKKIPSKSDVERITGITSQAYSTSRFCALLKNKRRLRSVEKTIRETVGKIRNIQIRTGWVSLKNSNIVDHPDLWEVSLSDQACPLVDIYE